MLKEFEIKTHEKQGLIDITQKIKEIVKDSNVANGICIVYIPHTTAGILINENYDRSVSEDILNKLKELVPENGDYKHSEGNSHAHIKSAIIRTSEKIIIENNNLLLGTWQGIFFAEFDGPRKRKVYVKIIKG